MRIRVNIVLVLMTRMTRGVVACLDRGQLSKAESKVGTRVKTTEGGPHTVDGEGLVVEDGVIEGFSVQKR